MNIKTKNYRWIIVALLFMATTINYIDRQIIGLLKPILEIEFKWSESDFARIVVAFTAAYAIGLLLFGRLIDRVGTKIGYSLSVVIWSLMGMLHAAAKTVTGFSLARIGLGLGEAGNFPAAMKTVAEWFPKKERGLAAGIFNSGTSIGVVIALLITPWILVNMGWQQVFIITGALGFLWLILWLWLYEIPAKQKYLSREEFLLITEQQEDTPAGRDTTHEMGPVIYLSANMGVHFWQVPHRPDLLVFLILAAFLFLVYVSSRLNPA